MIHFIAFLTREYWNTRCGSYKRLAVFARISLGWLMAIVRHGRLMYTSYASDFPLDPSTADHLN